MNSDATEIARREKKRVKTAESGLLVAGDALSIFGSLPLELHLLYYVGTLPFASVFLYFWFDMLKSAYAQDTLIVWSLLLPVLFVWMKCWQAVYVNALNGWLYNKPSPRYSVRGVLRLVAFTAILQPLGFIVVPLAMAIGVPYPAAVFFFQDVLLSEALYEEGYYARCAESLRCSCSSPGQGLMLVWLFSPWQMCVTILMIGLIIFVNRFLGMEMAMGGEAKTVAGVLVAQISSIGALSSPLAFMLATGISALAYVIPWILEHLLGIETAYSHGFGQMLSSLSFMAVVFVLVFMFLDPLVKISTVIRRFQYLSRSSGEDILFSLKELSRKARKASALGLLLLAGLVFSPSASRADVTEERDEPSAASAVPALAERQGKLDVALDETLRKSRYTWRMPRELADSSEKAKERHGWLKGVEAYMQRLRERADALIRRFGEWMKKIVSRQEETEKKGGWWDSLLSVGWFEGLFYLLTAGLVGIALFLFGRWLKKRGALMPATASTEGKAAVDIHDQGVSPDDLPPDEWLEMAFSFVDQGDYRAAMRALFLSVLAKLGQMDLITLRSYKSNRDYMRELSLRARGRGEIIELFKGLRGGMECTWYGFAPATEQMWRDYLAKSMVLREACDSQHGGISEEVKR